MLVPLVAIVLLIGSVGAIYLLLRSMGQDGVEVAAPGSCKSGRCGVQHGTAAAASCHQEDDQFGETAEIKESAALDRQRAVEEQHSNRLG
jgi:hypothetical protein